MLHGLVKPMLFGMLDALITEEGFIIRYETYSRSTLGPCHFYLEQDLHSSILADC